MVVLRAVIDLEVAEMGLILGIIIGALLVVVLIVFGVCSVIT
jgi:hypothetical protein